MRVTRGLGVYNCYCDKKYNKGEGVKNRRFWDDIVYGWPHIVMLYDITFIKFVYITECFCSSHRVFLFYNRKFRRQDPCLVMFYKMDDQSLFFLWETDFWPSLWNIFTPVKLAAQNNHFLMYCTWHCFDLYIMQTSVHLQKEDFYAQLYCL